MNPQQIQELATCIRTMCGIFDIGTNDLIYAILDEDFITANDAYALMNLPTDHVMPPTDKIK